MTADLHYCFVSPMHRRRAQVLRVALPFEFCNMGNGSAFSLEKKPLGAGAMKTCYKVQTSESGLGKHVLKVISPDAYMRGLRITHLDIRMQEKASELVNKFNSEANLNKKAYMHVAILGHMKGMQIMEGNVINDGELFIVEQMIEGEFEKFNSNTGWSSGYSLPDALSHWTWVYTGGHILLCDLQGHRGRPGGPTWRGSTDYYMFTDPALMSLRAGQFGCTDLGAEGISTWFEGHVCNDVCRSLRLAGKVPGRRAFTLARQRGTTWQ